MYLLPLFLASEKASPPLMLLSMCRGGVAMTSMTFGCLAGIAMVGEVERISPEVMRERGEGRVVEL